MGQRTQLVLKLKDRFGNVRNKVYHEQWGFAKTMPMIILQFLISLNYGSRGQKKYVDKYNKPNIVDMRELKVLDKSEVENTVRDLQETSILNLELNSWNVSDEYEDGYITENGTVTHNKDNATPLLYWDFDISNTDNVRKFTGDNNDGLALISVEEKFDENKDIQYEIKVGFLVSEYYTTTVRSEKIDTVAVNRYHDLFSYTKRDKAYCPTAVMKAIAELYDYFDVEQLGKDFSKKKELAKV